MSEQGTEMMEVVTRRLDVLEAVDGPRTKRDVVDDVDHSRSTVNRAVRELEARGLITRDDGYRRTLIGDLVVERVLTMLGDLEDIVAAEELLRPLPRSAPMSHVLLRDATVRSAEPPSPAQALDPIIDIVERCDSLRGLSVASTRPGLMVERFEDRVEAGTSFEWVFNGEMADYMLQTHSEAICELHATGNFDMYQVAALPYGLGLATVDDERHTFLALYDDERNLRGAILTDDPEAFRWAEGVYESYREDADRVTP